MTFLNRLLDAIVAPVFAWLDAMFGVIAGNVVALADWATAHPLLAVGVPALLVLVLTAITRLENRRYATGRRSGR